MGRNAVYDTEYMNSLTDYALVTCAVDFIRDRGYKNRTEIWQHIPAMASYLKNKRDVYECVIEALGFEKPQKKKPPKKSRSKPRYNIGEYKPTELEKDDLPAEYVKSPGFNEEEIEELKVLEQRMRNKAQRFIRKYPRPHSRFSQISRYISMFYALVDDKTPNIGERYDFMDNEYTPINLGLTIASSEKDSMIKRIISEIMDDENKGLVEELEKATQTTRISARETKQEQIVTKPETPKKVPVV